MRPDSPFDLLNAPSGKSPRPRVEDLRNERPDNTASGFADTLKRTNQASEDNEAASGLPAQSASAPTETGQTNSWAISYATGPEATETQGKTGADTSEAAPQTGLAANDEADFAEVDGNAVAETEDAAADLKTPASQPGPAQMAAAEHAAAANTDASVTPATIRDQHNFNMAPVQPLPTAANSNSRGISGRDTASGLKASLTVSTDPGTGADTIVNDARHTTSQTATTFSTSDWLTGDGITAKGGDVFVNALSDAASKTADGTTPFLSAPGQAAPQHTGLQPVNPPIVADPGLMKPHTSAVAAPEELVDVVSSRVAGGDRPDKITVQLDPPELGRVSIEFKFDANGLQQVSVVGETPEAMKRLRLLHFDLIQSLADNGLTARDMTFSQNTPQRDPYTPHQPSGLLAVAEDDIMTAPLAAPDANRQLTSAGGGINLKL